jgi:hypothetical protein
MAKPFTANSNWTMQRGYSAGSTSKKSEAKAPNRKDNSIQEQAQK